MSSRSLTWRRIGVSAVALATVAAGMPLLTGSAASAAGPTTRLTITQDDRRDTAAAGTCTAITVTPSDFAGGPSDGATITVTLAESPNSGTHDVDFCRVENDSPFRTAPEYENANRLGGSPEASTTQEYNPGPSITTAAAESNSPQTGSNAATPNNPDGPGNADPITSQATGAPTNNNNPSGEDIASFASNGQPIRFGVAGLLPGAAANINAFVDNDGDRTQDTADTVVAPQRVVTFTAGGRPGTPEASNAVATVDILESESIAAKSSATGPAVHTFRVVLKNDRGDLVGGVNTLRLVPVSGPNAPTSTSSGTFTSDCTPSGNQGQAAICTYRPTQVGQDNVMVFVNRGGAGSTFEFDPGEIRDFATATTTQAASTTATDARNIVLTPDQATIQAGGSRDFTAAVTDANGAPVNGVEVRFDESGPGAFASPTAGSAATSTVVMSTTGAGRVTVRFLTSGSDSGSNTITASIQTAGTQCALQASGSTPAGNCSDSSAVTITSGTASPSATPTATMSPRPTTSSTPPPSTPAGCTTPASLSLDVNTITATGGANVTVRGTANSVVDLFAYSRPSTTFRVVRSNNVGSDGAETYRITPPTNTRLFAQQRGCNASPSIVLNVRTQISLNVVRNGVRNYTFSGRLLPARPNGLIASLYRVTSDGRQILAAQQRANAAPGQAGYDPRRPEGSYSIRRQFTGSGRFGFVVRTGQDLQNAPGSSNVRSLAVF